MAPSAFQSNLSLDPSKVPSLGTVSANMEGLKDGLRMGRSRGVRIEFLAEQGKGQCGCQWKCGTE